MAYTAMHGRKDSGVSVQSIHSLVTHETPPSPTLTNPDSILPILPWQRSLDSDDGQHPLLEPEIPLSQTLSHDTISTQRNSTASEASIHVATAVPMPMGSRLSARPLATVQGASASMPSYAGYEHGAPLSDIYEESEANGTPRSARRRTISPVTEDERGRGSTTPTKPSSRHKTRLSVVSTSSSGSDLGDWEHFDSSRVLSSRVAADLAQLRREDTLDVDEDTIKSRRQSREEEELAALNARAEQILENARKRLTHMEDNLKFARNSIVMSSRSPNLGAEHQPVGGLYRSISAAGASKLGKNRQGGSLALRTTASLQHMRGASDAGVPSATMRLSRLPDSRSASALEYGAPTKYSLFPPDTKQSPTSRFQPSPASSRSYTSPLRPLEEERGSLSTAETTPESVKAPLIKGLGILSPLAAASREKLATTGTVDGPPSQQTPTPSQSRRSTSSASTKSAKELKEQMTDLKIRIAELRSKTQEESLRRRSFQSSGTISSLANAAPEQWYASSLAYKETGTPVSATAGVGCRSPTSPTSPKLSKPALQLQNYNGQKDSAPVTPANARFLDIDQMTPDTEAKLLSSARTDRNTPSLARKRNVVDGREQEDDVERQAVDSIIRRSHYEHDPDKVEDDSDDDTEPIAENEEEQVYLNEVLEESLRDAEVEPEVPAIPATYVESSDGVPVLVRHEAQRHEDRLDAFDYENMFLHSAMGTYTGRSINGSDSGSDADTDNDGSVETSRADSRTPVDDAEEEQERETEPAAEKEKAGVVTRREGSGHVRQITPQSIHTQYDQKQLRTPPTVELPRPPKSWVHARGSSIDSEATSATFETATEGERYGATPVEILNWDPAPSSSVGYSPIPYQVHRGNQTQGSPIRNRHGFSSPQGGGRTTPSTTRSPTVSSPLRQEHFEVSYDHQKATQSPGLGLGVIGAENGQYINDNGVPERFQGRPSPTHSRQSSVASVQQSFRPESQATIVAVPAVKGHKRQYSSIDRALRPLTPTSRTASPVIVTVASSPQRQVVINKALQRPGSYHVEPQTAGPPNAPLPAPPSSAILQGQMATSKEVNIRRSGSNAQKRAPPMPQGQYVSQKQQQEQLATSPELRHKSTASSLPGALPNTEVLMESLIKLTDPSFTLAPGIRFEEADKTLVLSLLGAVGGVCNGVLRAGMQSGSPAMGKTQAEQHVYMLRTRLEEATAILKGQDREVPPQRGARTVKEI